MSDQEDPMRTAVKQVHQWTTLDSESPRRRNIEKWLFLAMFVWPVINLVIAGVFLLGQFGDYVLFFGSPVVVAILAGFALRRYPATRKFLKTLVGLLLITTVLWGGFLRCTSLAHQGKLLSTIEHTYSTYSDAEPSLSMPRVMFSTYCPLVSQPLFHVGPPDANATLRGTIVGMFGYTSLFLYPYAPMLGPYYLLLLLITPSFLAFPVFWLWVVLSILYVVLPSRTWKWIGNTLRRAWSVVWHRKSM
jgi:nitrate reductase NapE component